jgi:exodeoxyribonuclease-1
MNPAHPAPAPAAHTFVWHDYETFGTDVRRDRPAQFAAIRTDAELREIGEPVMAYCQPATDYLPDPDACLITGITPQECLAKRRERGRLCRAHRAPAGRARHGRRGLQHHPLRRRGHALLFWRNLIDPYAREWQNGCGRWDLLDLVRACHGRCRPEGIDLAAEARTDAAASSSNGSAAANGLAARERRTTRCRTCAPPSRWRA